MIFIAGCLPSDAVPGRRLASRPGWATGYPLGEGNRAGWMHARRARTAYSAPGNALEPARGHLHRLLTLR
ncbi:MAG: hypothetical protein EBS94_03585 [Proteobacteria bacterium]|nr:hypothetical protein [Pseudomonadota bacterium]